MSKLIPLRWVGPVKDSSGYGSATRNYICSLLDSGQVNLTVTGVTFEQQHTNHGELGKRVASCIDNPDVPYSIQIVHLTPENYPHFINNKKYNIGYTTWEADILPAGWTDLCNKMDEIWVPSEWNKKVFANSGVTKPIHVIPHVVPIPNTEDGPHLSTGIDSDVFVFYTIMQWLERKNPLALLRAYLTEFRPDEKVCLALKSYRLNTSFKEKEVIKKDIQAVKKGLNIKDFPEVRFFGNLFSQQEMHGFHKRGDCFVLPTRAEGFGLPIAEAMAYGNPVVTSNYGGAIDFANKTNSYLIDCHETPICNMLFPKYNGHMTWGDPSIGHMKKLMREVLENRKKASKRGAKAQVDIRENLSSEKISTLIINRLKQISERIQQP